MAKKCKNLTSKADFALFCAECRYWLNRFGLKHFLVFLSHAVIEDIGGAYCEVDMTNWVATLTLNAEPAEKLDRYLIRMVAFHEVCELRFAEVRVLCSDPEKADLEIHKILRVLENSVFKDYIAKNKFTPQI